jgi:hypothetical protein
MSSEDMTELIATMIWLQAELNQKAREMSLPGYDDHPCSTAAWMLSRAALVGGVLGQIRAEGPVNIRESLAFANERT